MLRHIKKGWPTLLFLIVNWFTKHKAWCKIWIQKESVLSGKYHLGRFRKCCPVIRITSLGMDLSVYICTILIPILSFMLQVKNLNSEVFILDDMYDTLSFHCCADPISLWTHKPNEVFLSCLWQFCNQSKRKGTKSHPQNCTPVCIISCY